MEAFSLNLIITPTANPETFNMKIGLWNIDHPEAGSGNYRKDQRFKGVVDYLSHADCDVYVLTEANAAMELPGYSCALSAASPFRSSSRCYGSPNSYHQVAIYSKRGVSRSEVAEPINGIQVAVDDHDHPLELYGNVITIKDQWCKTSDLSYADRLDQQLEAFRNLPSKRVLVAGDFNLRLGWTQKRAAYEQLQEAVEERGWVWPTRNREDTVQHVLHSRDLDVEIELDFAMKYDQRKSTGLSDHPFIEITVQEMRKICGSLKCSPNDEPE